MEQDERKAFLAAARASVAQQQANYADSVDKQWRAERGQARSAAAVLELSRIDDEKLSKAALAASKDLRELHGHDLASFGARGPTYSNPHLPQQLVGNADGAERTTFVTGKGGRNDLKRNNVSTIVGNRTPGKLLALPAPQTPKRTSGGGTAGQLLLSGSASNTQQAQTGATTPLATPSRSKTDRTHKVGSLTPHRTPQRPVELYWRHLFAKADAPKSEKKEPRNTNGGGDEQEDEEEPVDDPTRDPMAIITELRKEMKFVPDPNAHALRIALQFLRLVYGEKGGGGGGGDDKAQGETNRSTRKRNRPAASTTTTPSSKSEVAPATPAATSVSAAPRTPAVTPKGAQCGLTPMSPGLTLSSPPTSKARVNTPAGRNTATSSTAATPFVAPASDSKHRTPGNASKGVHNASGATTTAGNGKTETGGDKADGGGNGKEARPFDSTFAGRLAREKREAKKALSEARAADARVYLEKAMLPTDPEEVLDKRVTSEMELAEARKLKFMAEEKKEKYIKHKAWERVKAAVAERDRQRARIRRAVLEIWIMELHQERPNEAAAGMSQWLAMARGSTERAAALQTLHEALSTYEKLKGADYSLATHALVGSLGSLGDLHWQVLKSLVEEHPSEPHYLYALGRLEAQKWVPEGDDNHHRFSRTLMEKQQDADVKLRASLDARQKPPAFYGDKVASAQDAAMAACSELGGAAPHGHWQVDLREEQQALDDRDDFTRGANPSDGFLNGAAHRSATTIVRLPPQAGWAGAQLHHAHHWPQPPGRFTVDDLTEPAFLGGHDLGSRQPLATTSIEVQQHLQDSAAAAATANKEVNEGHGGNSSSTRNNSGSNSSGNAALMLPPLTPQGRRPLSSSVRATTPGRKGTRSGFTAEVQATRSPMRTPHPPSVSVNITPRNRNSNQSGLNGSFSGIAMTQSGSSSNTSSSSSSKSLAPPRSNSSLAFTSPKAKATVPKKAAPYVNQAATALASDLRISSSGADVRTPVRLEPRAVDFEKQRLYATSR